jgi:hypothetical protein
MKLKLRTLTLFVLLLLPVSLTLAQEPAANIESLIVAFWPDYDDPSVLVLMTGTLPADTPLPAEVTIPLPPGAEVNAVARIGEEGMADTQFQIEGDMLTLITPEQSFRVEFYAPYEVDGDLHSFDFAWNADLDVEEFIAEVQQPLNATNLTTQPAAFLVDENPSDGLTYHALPAQSLLAGTPFDLSFRYEMAVPGLTAGSAPRPEPVTAFTPTEAADASSGIDWLLVLGGVLVLALVVAITWLVATRSGGNGKARRSGKSSKPRKPAPKARETQATFCHNCGTQAEKGDVFCRKCGTELK